MVDGDTNNLGDVFVRDRDTGTTTRVSVATDGTQANGESIDPAISTDGRYVTYTSDASNLIDEDINGTEDNVLIHDRG